MDRVNVTEYLTWLDAVEDRRVESHWGHTEYRPCAAPFRHGCILSDGTVVPCCMDLNRRMPLGNVILSQFKTILDGNNYRQLRMQMLMENIPADAICHGCRNTVHEWT